MRDGIEKQRLLSYLGDARAHELARGTRIPQLAYEVLAETMNGYSGAPGDRVCPRDALNDLSEQFRR